MMRQLAEASLRLLRPQRLVFYKQLCRTQWLPPEELARLQQNKLRELLLHASRHVPFYRDFMREHGIEAGKVTLDRLSRFPLTNKRILTDRKPEFLADNIAPSKMIPTQTGGSTGTWFQFFSDRKAAETSRAHDMRARNWAGWRLGDKQAVLWGHPGEVDSSRSLGRRLRNLLYDRSLMLNAYNMDEANLLLYQERIMAYRPVLLLGYASAIAFLAEFLQRRDLPFPRLRAVICTAETLTDEFKRTIADYYACPVFNRYGCREVGGIAQHCDRHGGMHMIADHVIVEILDPAGRPCAPGQAGEVVVTDLDNFSMPFIRYRIGDVAVADPGRCPCGRGLPLLKSVEGRVSEIIVGKNGKYYSCQSPRLFGAGIPGFDQMQIVQHAIEEIQVVIAPNAEWSPESERMLVERMQKLLGEVSVKIKLVDNIPPSPSGKYRFTISKVSPFLSD